jgi:predicted 2-oxoglutarate/Fe(II)-dependent dioxygenase YbiX
VAELDDVLAAVRSNPHVVDAATSPLLTAEECREILGEIEDAGWVDDPPTVAHSAPRVKQEHRLPGGNTGPLGQRIARRVTEVNDEIFGFRIVGLEDPLTVQSYDASTSGYISRHSDLSGRRSLRKLTFSVLVSDPSSFEGGDLTFLSGPAGDARVQGAITVFPSFTPHEVTPVTSGRRITIVGWALGPTFT